jgi:hypothetical protein
VDKGLSTISIEQRLCRIRGEYLKMPALRLTSAQAQRLLGMDQESCLQLLESLTRNDSSIGMPTARIRAIPAEIATRRVAVSGATGHAQFVTRQGTCRVDFMSMGCNIM